VPDPRLAQLAEIAKPKAVIPAYMEFVDIAGLVAGASKGEGLGNQFLGHIREAKAIAHVVRCFADDNVVHVAGKVDPINDIEVIQTELALADLSTVAKALERVVKQTRAGDKDAIEKKALLEMVQSRLDQGEPVRKLGLSDLQRDMLAELNLLTAKPAFYIANVDEPGLKGNAQLETVAAYADAEHAPIVTICAALEQEIASLDDPEKADFLLSYGLTEPGLNRVIRAGYQLLGLQTYLTAGPKEVRAWTIKEGMSAPAAAGVIHTDFERGFIRAEVIAFNNYIRYHGEQGAKDAGKWRLEGKEYIVRDGDVMHFRFNT
jgi:hypothetical protein